MDGQLLVWNCFLNLHSVHIERKLKLVEFCLLFNSFEIFALANKTEAYYFGQWSSGIPIPMYVVCTMYNVHLTTIRKFHTFPNWIKTHHKLFKSHYDNRQCGQLFIVVWWLFQISGHNNFILLYAYDEIIPNNKFPNQFHGRCFLLSWPMTEQNRKTIKNNHDHFIHFNTRIIIIMISK